MSEQRLLLLCRPGFEKECLAEITEVAAEHQSFGWASPEAGSGLVVFNTEQAESLYDRLPALVFTREVWPVYRTVTGLPAQDRITPILAALEGAPVGGQVFCDTAEGEAYRATARFAGKFVHPLRQAMRDAGLLSPRDDSGRPAWHALFIDSGQVMLGLDDPAQRPRWPMGMARLKVPAGAPSRSAMKLEEACHVFLGPDWRQRLQNNHTAVDLGAAPGGWTWLLVQQGLTVHAVDNGPMADALMATGRVEHHRADGFRFEPAHRVDWLVCDMVEQPHRVAERMVAWVVRGLTDNALFNLKLPMKKRWACWRDIRDRMTASLDAAGIDYTLAARQLYFDREEITCCLMKTS